MGTVIRKDAAVEDILEDCRKTLEKAQAKGGAWLEKANEKIGPIVTLFTSVEGQIKTAQTTLTPLATTVAVKNDEADDLLGRVSDEIWNLVGRPAADPALAVLFPGGIAYYADGSTEEQPDRMEVLAQLLLAGLHPKLPQDKAAAAAAEVTASAAVLRSAVDAARQPAAKLGALQRIRVAVARIAQIELGNLKRLYKAAGFTEAEIHTVIPDRPLKASKPAAKAPVAPTGEPPAPAAPGGAPPA